MRRFENRVVAVIGAGSGMGRSAAMRMAAEGGHVYVVDLSGPSADRVAAEINEGGGSAVAVAMDASDVDALRELYARIDREHGVLHAVHFQVGVPGPDGLDVSEESWASTVDVNLKAAYYATTLCFDLLEKAGGKGSISITSTAAAIIGSPRSPIYSMTKGALLPYTRALALVGAKRGIRVNVICPGMIDTPMLPSFFGAGQDASSAELIDRFKNTIPLGRACHPDEVGAVIAFLNSDDASYVTGTTLPIDGGVTVQ